MGSIGMITFDLWVALKGQCQGHSDFESFVSCKGAELGHMLPSNINSQTVKLLLRSVIGPGNSRLLTGVFQVLCAEWPWYWPFNVTQVECDNVNGLTIYGFLLMFNSNIWPNSAPLRDMSFQNLSDLEIDLSRSMGSNVITPIDYPYIVYAFLSILNGNTWPNSIPSFTRYKVSKSQWPWLWPFQVTQSQMWWCHWTLHIWFPIDIDI